MTAKEAASISADGSARRVENGFVWIWKADVNLGFRAIITPSNFDDWRFKKLSQEEIEASTDWMPCQRRQFRRCR